MIKETRVCGVICAIEVNIETDRYSNYRDRIFALFMERGVFLRPLGNVVYILPPFVITDDQLDTIYQTIIEVVETMNAPAERIEH